MFPSKIQNLIEQPSFDQDLRTRLEEWAKFPSFIEFANQNETKIVKNLRTKVTDEDKRDIGVELYVGFIFSETNCQVIYEPDVPSISRNPDFKITFESNCFYFEVRRLRENISAPEHGKIDDKTGDKTYMIDNKKMLRKCGDVICEKIGQTVARAVNLVYIRTYIANAPNIWDIQSAVKSLKEWRRTEPHEFEEKIKRYGIYTIDEFNNYWKQLSAIAISRLKGDPSQIWENPDSLNPLPQDVKSKIEEATALSFRYDSPLFD